MTIRERGYYMTIFKSLCVIIAGISFLFGCSTLTMTPLIKAASSGDVVLIQSLIRQGNAVNEPDKGKYYALPIHKAVYYGHVEAVKILLDEGASVNGRDYCDQTPLVYAINGNSPGRIEIANLLISKGADVEAIDCFGWKALNYAERASDKTLIGLLSAKAKGVVKTGIVDPAFKPEEHTINFRNAIPKIEYSGTKKLAITVIDKRKYVVSGKLKPNYVGYVKPYFARPAEDMTTTDNLPFGDVLTSCISLSLKNAGFEVNELSTKPDRSLVLIINEWMSDAGYNVGFAYSIVLQVMDKNGALLSSQAINGLDDLGSAKGMLLIQSKLLVPDAAKKRLSELFNHREVKKALQ